MCERPSGRSPANALAQALVWFVLGMGASWAQDAPVQPIDRSKLLQKRVVPAQAPTESMTQVPAQAATRKPTPAAQEAASPAAQAPPQRPSSDLDRFTRARLRPLPPLPPLRRRSAQARPVPPAPLGSRVRNGRPRARRTRRCGCLAMWCRTWPARTAPARARRS